MKAFMLVFILMTTPALAERNNFNDDLDKNTVPSELEARENEVVNQGDLQDANMIPAVEEERKKQEQVESDMVQDDDPDKVYDPADEEWDE